MKFCSPFSSVLFLLLLVVTTTKISALTPSQASSSTNPSTFTSISRFARFTQDEITNRVFVQIPYRTNNISNSENIKMVSSPLCVWSFDFGSSEADAICRMLGYNTLVFPSNSNSAQIKITYPNISSSSSSFSNITTRESQISKSASFSSGFTLLPSSNPASIYPIMIGGLKCPSHAQSLSQCDFLVHDLSTDASKTNCFSFQGYSEVGVKCEYLTTMTNITTTTARKRNSTSATTIATSSITKVTKEKSLPSLKFSPSPSSSTITQMYLDDFTNAISIARRYSSNTNSPENSFNYFCLEEIDLVDTSVKNIFTFPSSIELRRTICSSLLGIYVDQVTVPEISAISTSNAGFPPGLFSQYYTSMSCEDDYSKLSATTASPSIALSTFSPSNCSLTFQNNNNKNNNSNITSTKTCSKILGINCLPSSKTNSGFTWKLSNTITKSYEYDILIQSREISSSPSSTLLKKKTVQLQKIDVTPISGLGVLSQSSFPTGSICDDILVPTSSSKSIGLDLQFSSNPIQDTADLICKKVLSTSSSSATNEFYRAEAFGKMGTSSSPVAPGNQVYIDDTSCSPSASTVDVQTKNGDFFATNCIYSSTNNNCVAGAEDLAVACTNEGFRAGDFFFKFGSVISSSTPGARSLTTLHTSPSNFFTASQWQMHKSPTIVTSTTQGALFMSRVKNISDPNSPSLNDYGLVCHSVSMSNILASSICASAFDFDPRFGSYTLANLQVALSEIASMSLVQTLSVGCIGTGFSQSPSECKVEVVAPKKAPCYADTTSGPVVQSVVLSCTPYVVSNGYQFRQSIGTDILQIRPNWIKNSEKSQWGYLALDTKTMSKEEKQETVEALCSLLYPNLVAAVTANPSDYITSFSAPASTSSSFLQVEAPLYLSSVSCLLVPKSSSSASIPVLTSFSECKYITNDPLMINMNTSFDVISGIIIPSCYQKKTSPPSPNPANAGAADDTEVLRNLVIVIGLVFCIVMFFVVIVVAKIRGNKERERDLRRMERREARRIATNQRMNDLLLLGGGAGQHVNLQDFQAVLQATSPQNNNNNNNVGNVNGGDLTTRAVLMLSLLSTYQQQRDGNNPALPDQQQQNTDNNYSPPSVPQIITVGQVVTPDGRNSRRRSSSRNQHGANENDNDNDDSPFPTSEQASAALGRTVGYLSPRGENSNNNNNDDQQRQVSNPEERRLTLSSFSSSSSSSDGEKEEKRARTNPLE